MKKKTTDNELLDEAQVINLQLCSKLIHTSAITIKMWVQFSSSGFIRLLPLLYVQHSVMYTAHCFCVIFFAVTAFSCLPVKLTRETTDICLFAKDVDKNIRDTEPTILHYKELLDSQGISCVTEVNNCQMETFLNARYMEDDPVLEHH